MGFSILCEDCRVWLRIRANLCFSPIASSLHALLIKYSFCSISSPDGIQGCIGFVWVYSQQHCLCVCSPLLIQANTYCFQRFQGGLACNSSFLFQPSFNILFFDVSLLLGDTRKAYSLFYHLPVFTTSSLESTGRQSFYLPCPVLPDQMA